MLKAYIGYSREGGSVEGAVLVFAHTVKEAKKIGWGTLAELFTDEYTDMAMDLIREKIDYLSEKNNQKWSIEKIKQDIPHVVNDPVCCKSCETWGYNLDEEGYCEDCAEEAKEDYKASMMA